ncbi:MAG: LptA/OstA family protein [Microcoleaceae cyanobacterium]
MLLAKRIDLIIPRFGLMLLFPIAFLGAMTTLTGLQPLPSLAQTPQSQPQPNQAMTVRADIQEADANTGIVTARGNVQINYPSRNIQATAAQAQYFSRERRIVLSGDVYILQEGNSIRGETVTYLIDEGRFIALPEGGGQVESIYIVPNEGTTPETTTESFNPQPAFKTPFSQPAESIESTARMN